LYFQVHGVLYRSDGVMNRYLLIILLLPILAIAEDWDKRFDELCKFDKYCVRLKTQDGAWMKPKPEILAVIRTKEVQAEIHAAATKYGIDPIAVAASIVAENSMNVTKTDTAQTWLAKNLGITGIGSKKFSFGMGQINIDTALEAERYIAGVEKRAPRSQDELTQEIADPLGSVRVAAMIIRKGQDDYKAQGFDISKDIGVLTTLYNLGQTETRARDAKSSGKDPKMNYFGTFVMKYFRELKAAVGKAPGAVSTPIVAATAVSVPLDPLPAPDAPTEVVGKNSKRGAKVREVAGTKSRTPAKAIVKPEPVVPMVETETVSTSIPLVGAPLLCATRDEDRYDESKISTSSYGAPTGILEKGHSFRELSRSLDCNSVTWKLVETDTGASGWVKEETLDKLRGKRLEPVKSCDAELKAAATCADTVRSALGEKVVTSDSKTMVYASPVGPKPREGDSKVVNFEREDFRCRDRDKKEEDYSQPRYSRQANQMSLNDVAKEYEKYKQQYAQQRQQQLAYLQQQQQQMQQQWLAAQAAMQASQAASGSASSQASSQSSQTSQSGGGYYPAFPQPSQAASGPQSTASQPAAPQLSEKEVAEANFKFFDQQAKKLAKAVRMDSQDLEGAANPYSGVAEFINARRTQASRCSVILRSEQRRSCELVPVSDELKAAFEKLKYEKVPDVEQASRASRDLELAEEEGYQQGRYGRDRDTGDATPYMNYLPGEPELQNKTVEEIRAAIAECESGLAALKKRDSELNPPQDPDPSASSGQTGMMGQMGMVGMPGGQGPYGNGKVLRRSRSFWGGGQGGRYGTSFGDIGGYGNYDSDPEPFFRAAKVATDDQIKKYAAEFISLGKFCHSRLNVIKDSVDSGSAIQCTQAPDYMTIGDGQFARAIVAKTYAKNPMSLVESVEEHVPLFLKPDIVKEILGEDKFKPVVVAPPPQRRDEEREYDPRGPMAYCPNRTAEKIEDLLKDNPCIKRVFVPTRYLSKKLGPTDPRVVYRQFEQNDRYAVEVGSVTCEK
jgi:hypothetical protein